MAVAVNYQEALSWLYSTQATGIKMGLENTIRLLVSLGVRGIYPEPLAHPRILHVAGTNGKGSVCAMLDAICRANGLRTGLFTSPHLVSFRERMQVNGEMISEAEVTAGLNRIRDWVPTSGITPTFFEITTALALAWFQEQKVDVIVLETGMGGRLDSTNAMTPAVSVLTPIGMDHCKYLGNTLAEIAGEKAGIIKRGIPVVSAPQAPEAARVFKATAARLHARLEWVTASVRCEVALAGSHQRENAALALAALRAAGISISQKVAAAGLAQVQWPGRFQRLQREAGKATLILDGAHNEPAMLRLVQTWRETYGAEKPTVILGVLEDKDAASICRALTPLAREFILTPVGSPRGLPTKALDLLLAKAAPRTPRRIADSYAHALALADGEPKAEPKAEPPTADTDQAQTDGQTDANPGAKSSPTPTADAASASLGKVLITGSLFLIGEALAHASGTPHETSTQ